MTNFNTNMKKVVALSTLMICISFLSGCSLDFSQDRGVGGQTFSENGRHPTQEEWLEIYLTHKIEDLTDAWSIRISTNVFISSKTQDVVVTMTSANGERALDSFARNSYQDMVGGIVDAVLEDYPWTDGYKVTVQFI